ncbi:BON domain-containing protein [Phenylobacterium sp. 58.2.17]
MWRLGRVSVVEGRVTLDGKVHSWSEREAIERAAWSAAGVQMVVDHLRVG